MGRKQKGRLTRKTKNTVWRKEERRYFVPYHCESEAGQDVEFSLVETNSDKHS